jgi:signal transduction histidine kinase
MQFRFHCFHKILIILLLSVSLEYSQLICAQESQLSFEEEINSKLNESENDSTTFASLEELFNKYTTLDFNKSTKIGNKAIEIAKENNDQQELIKWYGKMSYLYMDYELYSLALDYIKLAMKTHKKRKEKIKWWLINIGNVYYTEEMYADALTYYFDALKLFNQSENKSDTIGIAVTYLNLAMVYEKTNQIDSATIYYHKSMQVCDLIHDYYRKTNASIHLSNMHLSINNFDSAKYYLTKAEEYNRLTSEQDLLHTIREKEGDYYAKIGEYDKALEYYDLSVKIAASFNDTRNLIKIYDKKAKVYTLLRKMDLAITSYKSVLKEALEINNIKRLVATNKLISELYFYKLNIDSAYHFLWEYANWKDTLDNLNLEMIIHGYEKESELKKIESLESELATEKEGRKIYKNLIFSALILFIIAVIFLYYVVKSKKKLKQQNDKIVEQNNTISSQVEEIMQQNDLLNTYKNNLENIVDEKTKHLEDAIKKAKESDLLKTAFLTNMSHEIRTPMNAVLGFGSLLSNSNLSETDRMKYTEILIKSTEQLHKVIDNIIEISKIESGQITVNKTFFDVNVLFEELMLYFSKQLFDVNKTRVRIEFTNQLSSENNMIVADRNIIKQIFINLIDNAIKFTESGIILFGCKLVDYKKIEFYVKDTGLGIDKMHFDTIFQRFSQVQENDRYKNKGVGLGLSISKSLVDKLNGELFVDSEKGKGSRFYFVIPYETQKVLKKL